MMKKDRDEKLIYDSLSRIDVDTSRIKKGVMEGLRKEKKKRKPFFTPVLAGALSLFLIVSGSAAILKNSEWFMKKFDPTFKEVVENIDVYSEDQGIRLELIAGQKYENNALVYLSIQDLTGEDRITRNTEFRDGFFLGMDSKESSFGYGMKDSLIDFDEETNTIYYEFNISTDLTSPLSEKLTLGASRIYFNHEEFEDELIEIPAKDMKDKKYISLREDQILGGSYYSGDYKDVLEAGRYSRMPHEDDSQWISNVGMKDGKLHVQIVSDFNQAFGPNDPFLTIENDGDEPLVYESSLVFLTDKEGKIQDIDGDLASASYKYEEFIFPEIGEKDLYKLYYRGRISYGLEGDWKIEADLSDGKNNVINIEDEIIFEDYKIEKISLNPLGLKISGTSNNPDSRPGFNLELDTDDGLLKMDYSGGITSNSLDRFDLDYKAEKPLSLDRIKAIIIDGRRIPIN